MKGLTLEQQRIRDYGNAWNQKQLADLKTAEDILNELEVKQ